nr:hypothetical protein [Tanacetum cinerariifolium]
MGTIQEPLAEGTEGAPHLGPERPRVYYDLSPEEKDRHLRQCEDAPGRHKRETIHGYYVRFAKLINDMRNIKMTMSRMQLNSKFVNNMLPEWGRFVTAVKLIRGSRDSNYDQLYAYLKQYETHAKENKMILSPTDNLIENLTNTLALLTQSYKTFLPQTNNQLRSSSNTRNQATVQDGRVVVQNIQGRQNSGYIARKCTQPKHPQNSKYYKGKMLLMQAQENRIALDTEQLLFLTGGHDNAIDDDVDEQPVQDLAL